jgi:glycerol-3-phosphate O-acyltransferase
LVPVSIVYDQLDEVREFASEATGGVKKAETIGWALKFIRSQHGTYGRIYVRFGEPISRPRATPAMRLCERRRVSWASACVGRGHGSRANSPMCSRD